jgi:hypothetical protein
VVAVIAIPAGSPPSEPAPGSRLTARKVGAPRAGRDRRHESPRRSRHITAAFTDAEYAAIATAARRVGLTPTGFCAHVAFAAATTGVTAPAGLADPRVEALAQLQGELAALRTSVVRIGTNLNQAVAVLNTRGEAPVWLRHVVEQCGRALGAVDDAASRVHRRLP